MEDQIIFYNFSNANKTLVGTIAFSQGAAADQQVTVTEGLKVSFTYLGQTYNQDLDPATLLLTTEAGEITDLGLGLQLEAPNQFLINGDNFIDANGIVQPLTYDRQDQNIFLNFASPDNSLVGTISFKPPSISK